MKKMYALMILTLFFINQTYAQPGNGNGNGNGNNNSGNSQNHGNGNGNGNCSGGAIDFGSGNNNGNNHNCGNGNGHTDDNDGSTAICPLDKSLECGSSTDPSVTGNLNLPSGYSSPLYWDEVTSTACPYSIIRHWSYVNPMGIMMTCDQVITVNDTQAPVITINASSITSCADLAQPLYTVSDCDPNPSVTLAIIDTSLSSSQPCDGGALRTQTQGGWGANPHGNNPGVYLHANFAAAFPNGLTIGCSNTLTLTSAQAVTNFLPSGTTPAALPAGTLVNPGGTYSNVLAGQLVAATLNVGFDYFDANFGASSSALGEMIMTSGPFAGSSINYLLQVANEVIGGCSTAYSYSQVNEALTALNENYDNGNINQGFLECSEGFDCALVLTYGISATDACGNTSTSNVQVTVNDEEAPVFEDAPLHITVSCEDLPVPAITAVDACSIAGVTVTYTESEFSGACYPIIQRIYTASDACGNMASFTQYISIIDTIAPIISGLEPYLSASCGEIPASGEPVITDNCDNDLILSFNESTSGSGCSQTIERIWTAMDHCGNTSTFIQTVDLSDSEAPVITGEANVFFSCTAGVSPIPLASDNCGDVASMSFTDALSGAGCEQIIQRTWTATDACGNSSVFVQTIHTSDEEPPVFSFVPADVTLPCGSALPVVNAIASDNCSDVTITESQNTMDNSGLCLQIMRVFIATDACGNMAMASQLVSFEDTEAPVFTNAPADYSGNCSDDTTPPQVAATDNCDTDVVVTMEENFSGSGCSLTIVRTWTASDDCGNTAVHQQQITLSDTQAPVFSAPQEITIGCHQFNSLQISVSDDCTSSPAVTFSDIAAGSGCAYDVSRTWVATDACNNSTVFTQVIHVIDEQDPVFTYIPPSMTVSCSYPGFIESPVVTDNCSSQLVPVMTQSVSVSGCNQVITRTWTVSDNCGNTSTASQVITITDTQAPVISGVPANQTINCNAYTYPAIPAVSASDNCDSSPSLNFNETTLPGECPGEFQITRTWTASDDCGNTAVASYTITVIDNTPPVFTSVPSDITVACGELPAPFNVTASDNCGNTVTIVYSEQNISGGCPLIYRTWVASDGCGNSSTFVQHITIQDDEAPVLSGIPSQGPVTCNNIPPVPDPVVTDNCDENVQVTYSETIIGTGCNYTMIRMWIAEDDCGNSSVVSQSIQLSDTAPPVFVQAPAEITISCNTVGSIAPPNVVDDCAGTVSTTFQDAVIGSGCSYQINRTWTATDLCGNSASALQVIHVVDETSPVIFGVPLGTFVSCNNIPAVPTNIYATDNCTQNVPVTFSQTTVGTGCNYQIIRTWTAVDACNNTKVRTQVIYVNDNSAPVFTNTPPSVSINCGESIPALVQPTVSDNCTANVNVTYFEFTESIPCGERINRVWSASDACGNSSSYTQQITITDSTAPVLANTPAANLSVSCNSIPAVANVTASDACSSATIVFDEDIIQNGCPYTIQRVWTASDACGNTSSFTQTILVSDNEAPVLVNVPADINLSCGDLLPDAAVSASDNCSGSLPVEIQETSEISGCTEIITRTWTAVDFCGNTQIATQTITITDDQMPVFTSLPEDLTVECNAVPEVQLPLASDCSSVVMEWTESTETSSCANQYSITRFFTATDQCGNQNQHIQQIFVVDESAPVLSDFPEDMTVTCSNIPEPVSISATDNCGETVEVSYTEAVTFTSPEMTTCELTTANSPYGNVVLWLPGLSGMTVNYVFGQENGAMERDEANGTAHITGQVYNSNNPSLSWIIDIRLVNRRNWTQWSALGRSYKDDLNVGGDNYLDWDYYELDPSSQLIGAGALEGSVLNLTHQPANYYYGFQLGLGANNRNSDYGMSGWFFYSGVVNGNNVSYHGDLIVENDCCPEQEILRTWTVQDCAGNTTIHTQTITVSHSAPIAQAYSVQPERSAEFTVSNTSAEFFTIEYQVSSERNLSIVLYDAAGGRIDNVYEGSAQAGTKYRLTYPKSSLDNGLYFFHFADGQNSISRNALMAR